jgi:tetratricopeptide (TPR) repeat protein
MKTSTTALIGLMFGLMIAPLVHAATPFPLLEGLGNHTRKISTASPEAQRYFDQGLALLHGFNHGSAIRSFQEAVRLDPECAMAHWGIALASGPHINFPVVPPPAAELAWTELVLAQQNTGKVSPVERDLIEALGKRYANPQPEDRSKLDLAYANAMREVWKKYPADTDVGAFFAEAMMDLRPWDQWTPEGKSQPGTDEIIATLDAVLKLDAQHPFANHLYIHAVEASPHPERALEAADRLRDLQPGLAHNVHMPSHIDIRIGRWHEAVEANLKAVDAVRRVRAAVGPPQGFILVYNAHNEHMLAYAAMMTGQSAVAIAHIRALVAGLPEDFLKEYAMAAEGFVAMPYEVLLRFGRWDDVLAEPDHAEYLPFTRAFRHAARAIAYAAKGNVPSAREEQTAFLAAAKLVPAEATFGNSPTSAIVAIATHMVEGEILYRDGKVKAGIAELREAVKLEDALRYDEPPPWILPARHSLGATLMAERRYPDAEQVYREDLKRLPENGWSLYGLAESLSIQGKEEEATEMRVRFARIWTKADVAIKSSCFCQPGK